MKRLLAMFVAALFATIGVSAFAADMPAPGAPVQAMHHHRHHHHRHHHHHHHHHMNQVAPK